MEEQKKIKYFIDFDGTLFNRDLFGRRLLAFLRALSFSQDESLQAYKAIYSTGYPGFEPHLDELTKRHPGRLSDEDIENAKQGAREFLQNNLKQYLFPQTTQFLASIDREKYDVYLITVGGADFQRAKVEGTGIENFFDDNHTIYADSTDKDAALTTLVKDDEHFILLDDKDATLLKVKNRFPESLMIQAGGGDLLRHLDPESAIKKEGEASAPVRKEDEDVDHAVAQPSVSDPNQQDPTEEPESYGPEVH